MESKLLSKKYFLYATEFFSGMSVMAVELGASRLMAPYFSSSQIVWTVIIGVIMIAMAIGNVWGGRSADKHRNPGKLYGRILVAAIWIALIPFVGRYLIAGISLLLATFVSHNFLVWAAFVTCLVIFAFPCVLLGTVTPSLVKYTMHNLDSNGKTMGELGALNTIGSIIGTFLPTFVTIPAVGTAATFLIFSGVLGVIAILYFISVKQKRILCGVLAAVLVALGCLTPRFSFAFWEREQLTMEDESIYNYLQVRDTDESTILSTNVLFGVQSIKMKQEGLTGLYYDYALAAPVMAGLNEKEDSRVMILGLGSGTFATYCEEYFPQTKIQGAEIDEKIVNIARDYFELPSSVEVAVEDGRAYLSASEEQYDVIMVDAYQDITIPFQMSSVEFFTEVSNHLKEDGVMVVNMNMRSSAEDSINDYLCDTIDAVFRHVYRVPVEGSTNMEVYATNSDTLPEDFDSHRQALEPGDLKDMMEVVAENMTEYQGQDRILTDDKAPVELLGMRVLDEIIQDELDYYRDLYL